MIVLLYYKYIAVPDPVTEAAEHKKLCEKLNLKGRIIIGPEGINGTCCGESEATEAYKQAMDMHPLFHGIQFKESLATEQVFAKTWVRARPEVVTFRTQVDLKNTGKRMRPDELHTALENHEEMVLIDMRNDYEARIGRFKDAVTLPMENFRDLPQLLQHLEPYKNKKVVTYCTGGIRCEKASALLTENGFADVSQLEGGIVSYTKRYPDGHFLGSCFVFDKRMAVRDTGVKPPVILTQCAYCSQPCDRYLDCRDKYCQTRLFICCEECERQNAGMCRNHAAVMA